MNKSVGGVALAPWAFFVLILLLSCSDTGSTAVGGASSALLSTVELTPIADTYLKNGSPNKNQGDEALLRVRQSGKNRVLLQFEQAAIEAAVAGEPVYEARVELAITQNGGQWGSAGRSVGIHRLLTSWTELGATWNCAEDSNTSNGTDDCPTSSWDMDDSSEWPFWFAPTSTTLATNDTTGVFSFDVTEDVQAFVSGAEPNLGWVVRLINENESGRFDFASRETGTPPKLVVTFGTPEQDAGVPAQCSATPIEADTYVRNGSPNQNEGGLGLLRIRSSGNNRALVHVDGQSLIDAAGGQSIETAELKFTIGHNGGNWGEGREVDLHRLLVPWDEFTSTWNCASDTNIGNSSPDCVGSALWDMDGAVPYDLTPTATVTVTNEMTAALVFDITEDVQQIVGGAPSYGWILKKREEGQAGLIELVSKEASATASGVIITCAGGGEDGGVSMPEDCRNGIDDDHDGAIDCADLDCQVGGPDGTCDGIDDDCDGAIDEDFTSDTTECGVGACVATGVTSCASGIYADSCVPGTPGLDDAICDGLDEDCDGEVDEGYVPQATSCGIGACAAGGSTSCVAGAEQDSCIPGTPIPGADTCSGVDEDCDGVTDEDFVAIPTSCGIGACASTGFVTCLAGAVVDTCSAGIPAADDATCDGVDSDCDGQIDEDCCIPATCQDYNIDCGSVDDGCGATIDCGVCTGEETCGGSGTPNVCSVPLPPDPETIAPPGPTGSGSFLDSLAFLTEDPTPVQTGVLPGALESHRAGLLRGRVLSHSGQPIPAVQVSIPADPSLGSTLSRVDGAYDLVVNGGGLVTLRFESVGYLPVQRTVELPWADALELPDVVMTVQSDVSSPVVFGPSAPAQLIEARTYQDDDGPRQVRGFIPQGTSAIVIEDSQSVPLDLGTLRVTEYTLGPDGPKAMPAKLPENSLYTFAADISLDEVGPLAKVEFAQTTYFYVDNFLEFPVGVWVPNGYYDFDKADWVAETDGLVMKVVGVTPGGLAEIDATHHDPQDPDPADPTGDNPLDAAQLADLGFSDEERQHLASLYWDAQTQTGVSFWRMPIKHLSPKDWNHAGFRDDPPSAEPVGADGTVDTDCSDTTTGSIIHCQSRTLAEEVPIAGTPFYLRYDSDRATANVSADRTAVIPLPDPAHYPQDAQKLVFRATVLGRTLVDEEMELPALGNKIIEWDGLDAFGRPWLGQASLHYTISYRYEEQYEMAIAGLLTVTQAQDSFGERVCACGAPCCRCSGGGSAVLFDVIRAPARQVGSAFAVSRTVTLGRAGGDAFGFGGWSLSHYHAYDPQPRVLIRGDGREVATASRSDAPSVAAGRSSDGDDRNDVATNVAEFSDISDPEHIAVAPDGAVYFTAAAAAGGPPGMGVWKLTWQRGVAQIFRDGTDGVACGSGGVRDLAVGPDGALYLACGTNGIVRLTERSDGTWEPAYIIGADPYTNPSWTDGASLQQVGIDARSLAFREDGRLLFTARQKLQYGFGMLDYGVSNRLFELIEVLADGRGRVLQAAEEDAQGDPVVVAVGSRIAPSASNTVVTYTGGRVVQIFASEVATTLMESSGTGVGFDWESTETHRADESGNFFSDIASSPDGDVYLAFNRDNCQAHKLYQISRSGEIRRVSLEGLPQDYGFSMSGCIQSAIDRSGGALLKRLTVGPEGLLYATSGFLDRIYSFGGSSGIGVDAGTFEVVSDDGSEIYHFSSGGLHVSTQDAETGAELFRFTHDAEGRLTEITDRDGRITTIERPDSSTIRFIAPPGPNAGPADEQVTSLTLNGEGYLEQITDPRSATWLFEYHPTVSHGGGLLARMWDPRANEDGLQSMAPYDFNFERFDSADESTRWLLKTDTDPVGGAQTISAEQLYSESSSPNRSATIFPIKGTWCDGREYTRGYQIKKTTTRVTRETSLGRTTTYDTSLSGGSPRLARLTKNKAGAVVTTRRTDPSGWFVERPEPDAKNQGRVGWPEGELTYTLTAHPRLGKGAMIPETSSLQIEAKTQPTSDARPLLAQDVTVRFDENNTFTPVVGFPTPSVERIYTTVAPTGTTVAPTRESWVEFTSDLEPKVTVTSPKGRTSTYVLDGQSRIVRVELPGQVPTTYVYDTQGVGFLDRVERLKGTQLRKTEFGYDGRGYVSSVQNKVSDTVTDQVTMVNDPVGFATETTVPGLLTVWSAPDVAGALASLTPDDKPEHRLSYTPLGQLSEYASPAGMLSTDGTCQPGTLCWRYSLDRELEDITLPDGTIVDYVYHPDKATLESVNVPGHGLTTFGYDSVGRRVSATAPTGGTMAFAWQSMLPIRTTWSGAHTVPGVPGTVTLNGTVERFYNDFLEVSELHVAGGAGMQLVRDRDGLLERVEDIGGVLPTLTLSRSAIDGHVTGTTLDTVTTTHVLDVSEVSPGFGDLVGVFADAGTTNLYDAFYTYDDRGRIDTWTETVLGSTLRRKHHYDGAGRLVEVEDLDTGNPIEEYAYDGNGNRTRAMSSGLSAELGTNLGCQDPSNPSVDIAANDQDQLCRYGDFEYRYNARGQLQERERVSDGAITGYTYDGLGRLKKVVTDGGAEIHYIHDALGRRIGKVVDDQLQVRLQKGWLYADALNPIAQLDSAGNVEATFVYGTRAHVPDAMVMADGTVYRLITDHLGSVRLVVNVADGTVVQRMDYDAFGRVLQDTSPGFQPFGFAGGLYDDDTGLVRFGARDYDPETGRWTAKDPAFFDAGWNLYAYVYGDPLNYRDHTGRIPFRNDSNKPITVWGNPGSGDGDGPQEEIVVEPGGQIDVNHPVETPTGPVTDVDFIDFDGDGHRDPGYFPFGDKIPGNDRGLGYGAGPAVPLGCSAIDNPFSVGPPRLPAPFPFPDRPRMPWTAPKY